METFSCFKLTCLQYSTIFFLDQGTSLFPILELVDLNIQKQTLFKKRTKTPVKHLLHSPDILKS